MNLHKAIDPTGHTYKIDPTVLDTIRLLEDTPNNPDPPGDPDPPDSDEPPPF